MTSNGLNPTADIGAALFGPGSQPGEEDGSAFSFLEMPSEMAVYRAPALPEDEVLTRHQGALEVLSRLEEGVAGYRIGNGNLGFDVTALGREDVAIVDQVLGEGEVSMIIGDRAQAQESVFAGIWRIRVSNENGQLVRDYIEVGSFPLIAIDFARATSRETLAPCSSDERDGLLNAPALVSEIEDQLSQFEEGALPHVINLSLLPHSEADLAFLHGHLGAGQLIILSRGYGNCRITSTGTRNVWWVQYFNSQDAIILNTIEICSIPSVACAGQDDIEDSAARLSEILEVYR